MTNLDELRPHIELLRWCKERKAEIKKLEENSRAAIEAAMGEDSSGTLDGVEAIRWTHYKANTLNQKALKAERPEIVAEYTELQEKRKFEVVD